MESRLTTLLIATTGPHNIQNLPAGFRFTDTPSHGYYYVSEELQQAIPSALREYRYEEDCAWSIPVFVHRHMFTREIQEFAIASLSRWYWKEFEKLTGIILLDGESDEKDKCCDRLRNIGNERVNGAYGSWCFGVPKGWVYVETEVYNGKGNEPEGQSYLIDKDEYQTHRDLARDNWLHLFPSAKAYQRDKTYYTWEEALAKGYELETA